MQKTSSSTDRKKFLEDYSAKAAAEFKSIHNAEIGKL